MQMPTALRPWQRALSAASILDKADLAGW